MSFNIDQCLLNKTDKISISLLYDEKLNVEKEKKQLDQFQESVNSVKTVGKSFMKLRHTIWIFIMGAYFSIEILHTQLALNLDN